MYFLFCVQLMFTFCRLFPSPISTLSTSVAMLIRYDFSGSSRWKQESPQGFSASLQAPIGDRPPVRPCFFFFSPGHSYWHLPRRGLRVQTCRSVFNWSALSCHLGCRFVVGENTWIILLARMRPGSLSDAFALAERNSSYAKQTHRPYHTQWCYICWLMQMTDLSQSIYIRGGKLTFWSSSLCVWQIPAFNQTTHYSI